MVSFSECIYRGYRITAWAQASRDASAPGFIAHAVVAGTAAAVMDYRLPVPHLDAPHFDQPASARHHAEGAARAYIDELVQAHTIDEERFVERERERTRGYRRERDMRVAA